jgi:hypothetical protein
LLGHELRKKIDERKGRCRTNDFAGTNGFLSEQIHIHRQIRSLDRSLPLSEER